MYNVVYAIHIIVSLALILIVLLQTGKGAGMGAAFGGASQTVFGSSGASTLLGKLTTAAAVIFMCSSLFLAYSVTESEESTVVDQVPASSAPAAPQGSGKPAQ